MAVPKKRVARLIPKSIHHPGSDGAPFRTLRASTAKLSGCASGTERRRSPGMRFASFFLGQGLADIPAIGIKNYLLMLDDFNVFFRNLIILFLIDGN
ncbi:hypothetical protein [Bordetella avium]|uniref:hypothetical protein n=1 Tax=Bordetella avium TaxID=521 RepID=UPI000FDA4574|nr:hypothetical protein [Bordetella avium]